MSKGRTTIHDIAESLNISAATVSRALNDNPRISGKTRRKVKDYAKQHNYFPNTLASSLRHGKSKTIGIILPSINRAFFSAIAKGVEEVARKQDYRVIISQSHDDPIIEASIVETLINARVEGVLVSLGKKTVEFEHYAYILQRDIPLIQVDRVNDRIPGPQIVLDDFRGAYLAVQHLLEQGFKHIAHFTGGNNVNIYAERLRGYTSALQDNGIVFDPDLVIENNMQLDGGVDSTTRMIEEKLNFDAIFSASDYAAAGAMQVLKKHKIKIPEEVGIIGFGSEPFTSFTDPELSTVCQFPVEMGQRAAERLFDSLSKPESSRGRSVKEVLIPEVIFRNSSLRS